jgi:hypothetical protein
MNRTHVRRLCLAAVLLLTLGACGGEEEETFQARLEGGSEDSFTEFTTQVRGTDPVELSTCSKDPTPQISDDERTLCLRIYLDAQGLSAAGAPATFSIMGTAKLAEAVGPTPATFTAAEGHSPEVVTAWATVGCFAPHLQGPFVQRLQGRLELEENTSKKLAGRVVLTTEGQLSVTDCGRVTSANFDFRFDVAR